MAGINALVDVLIGQVVAVEREPDVVDRVGNHRVQTPVIRHLGRVRVVGEPAPDIIRAGPDLQPLQDLVSGSAEA